MLRGKEKFFVFGYNYVWWMLSSFVVMLYMFAPYASFFEVCIVASAYISMYYVYVYLALILYPKLLMLS